MHIVGKTLAELRKAKNLSQLEFSERVGVSRQTISKWESGAVQPTDENIQVICTVLEIDESDLTVDRAKLRHEETLKNIIAKAVGEPNLPQVETIAVSEASESSVAYEAEAVTPHKRGFFVLYMCLAIFSAIMLIFVSVMAVYVGSVVFSPNKGVLVVSSQPFNGAHFALTLIADIILLGLEVFSVIMLIILERKAGAKDDQG